MTDIANGAAAQIAEASSIRGSGRSTSSQGLTRDTVRLDLSRSKLKDAMAE